MAAYDVRPGLYTADQLLEGFDPHDPMGFVRTHDFQAFKQFVIDGGAVPKSLDVRRRQAEHDAHMSDALREHLTTRPRLVGVMGGHKLERKNPAYAAVARLARALTRRDCTIVTGGGPGAMEAAHLGAMCALGDDALLDNALHRISDVEELPDLRNVLNPDGSIADGREKDLKGAHSWLAAALDVRELLPDNGAPSLAVPTWLYGQEPTMPFATHYAKYFHNSIREETLVTEARAGIVYARGGGGTVREIFQDVEQNYYAPDANQFTPMIFFDSERYWERDATFDQNGAVTSHGIKLDEVLPPLIRYARARFGDASACLQKVVFTTDFAVIADLIEEHASAARVHMSSMLIGSALALPRAAANR